MNVWERGGTVVFKDSTMREGLDVPEPLGPALFEAFEPVLVGALRSVCEG